MTARCASSMQAVLIRTAGGISPYRRNRTCVFPDPGGPLARQVVRSVIIYPLFRAFSTCNFRAVKRGGGGRQLCCNCSSLKAMRIINAI